MEVHMKCLVAWVLSCSLIIIDHIPACAQEWQWSVAVSGGKDNAHTRAWLWVAPSCTKIRAVVVAQHNMEELSILENEGFRQRMGELGMAEIWVSPGFDHTFNFTQGAGEVFNQMMDALADSSGYEELKYSPIVAIGHSAAASWPYYFAAWNPGRTLACISVSGQWPYFRHPSFAPDIWTAQQNIDGIPLLETMGEYEAADSWSTEGLKERVDHPHMALSMLACPAEGHFAASQKKIDYLAFYIKKAAEYRLPDHDPLKGAPELRKIDPTRTGWLMDRWRNHQAPTAVPAPVGEYKGDKAAAFWFIDEETARMTEQYESAWRDRLAPLLGYVQEGKIVPQRNTHLQVHLQFLPAEDGISFTLKGAFLDTVPGESPRPAMWTGLPAGAVIHHPDELFFGHGGGTPISRTIRIDKVFGPFEKINDTLFRLAMGKGIEPWSKHYALTFAATSPGDDVYKPAVQQAEMLILPANTEGIEQHISFPPVPDQREDAGSLRLEAVSDVGLPVHYFVLEGSATVKGDVLYLTSIPPRSRRPVKVTVVAWQYGRSAAPRVRTADMVSRTFFIKQ